MKTQSLRMIGMLSATVLLAVASTHRAEAAAKSWISSGDGQWATGANWSPATAPGSGDNVLVTNATTKTVTVDGATPVGNLTVADLRVTGPAGTVNTLHVANTVSPLLLNGPGIFSLGVGAGGRLIVTNATIVSQPSSAANVYFNGQVTLQAGGSILHTNVNAHNVFVGGDNGVGLDANGTLTIAGGKFESWLNGSQGFLAGFTAGRTGTVWVTGGELVMTNNTTKRFLGQSGVGVMVVSNGTVRLLDLEMGINAGSRGSLVIAGGTADFGVGGTGVQLGLGKANATGTVQVTGGSLLVTNGNSGGVQVGIGGHGTMDVTGGTVLARALSVGGNSAGTVGTLTVGGSGFVEVTLASQLSVGGVAGSTGRVVVTGGTLLATNTGFTAFGWAGSGRLDQSGGLVRLSNPLIGNGGGTGTLTISGGTFEALAGTFGNLVVGRGLNTTGTVALTGGTLRNDVTLGLDGGRATMTVSGGLLTNTALVVGSGATSIGRFTVRGTNATVKLTSYTQNSVSTFNPTINSGGISPVVVSGTATRGGTLDIDLDGGIALFQTNVFTMMRKQAGTIGGAYATTAPSVFTVSTATDGADQLLQATLDLGQLVTAEVLTATNSLSFAATNRGMFAVSAVAGWRPLGLEVDLSGATKTIGELALFMEGAGYDVSTNQTPGFAYNLYVNLAEPMVTPSYFAWDFTAFDAGMELVSAGMIPEPSTLLLLVLGGLVARRARRR